MNLDRADAVDTLMHLSIETRELIENCEKATEETKLYKSKSEILEEEVRRISQENETLKRENQNLRDKLKKNSSDGECWISIVKNANQELNNVTPKVSQIFEKLRTRENAQIQLERELFALKEENAKLLVVIEEKNELAGKQNADFLNIQKMVNDYQLEVARLDTELRHCHSRVSTLNENLELINAENLDLAEYTNFKCLLKKFGANEDVNEVFVKLQSLYEIEELFDKKLSPHISTLTSDQTVSNLIECDQNSNIVTKVKNYLEKALNVIEKLNENHIRSSNEYETVIQTKDDEIAKLKELSCHLGLYNEIMEKTLKQCRDNAKMDRFVEERTSRLIDANKTLHDNFEQLTRIYKYCYRYNDQLFAKFNQLRSWYRILKIRVNKITSVSDSNAESSAQTLPPLSDFFEMMDELFGEIDVKRVDFDKQTEDSNQIFENYEASLAANDHLKNTVDNMTMEVKRLTCQVEQQMSEKIREIESLKSEVDSVKTDNHQLANKIKNCNNEIILLSTENYDLNEKLSIVSRIENDYEALKSELQSTKGKLDQRENHPSTAIANVDKVFQLRDSCAELKRKNVDLKEDVSSFTSTFDVLLQRTVQLVNSTNASNSNDLNKQKRRTADLNALQIKCSQFKHENQNLKLTVESIRRQMHDEISSMQNNLHNALVSSTQDNVQPSNIVGLLNSCRDLKQFNQQIKNEDFFSSAIDMVENAKGTLSNKLEKVSQDLNHLQSNLNATVDAKNQYKESVCVHLQSISKIVQDLRALREVLSNLVKTLVADFAQFNSTMRRNIQEAIANTFDNVKQSIALSNEEVIKEMQEVNSELKNRSETIFVLNQQIDELKKENVNLSQSLAEREKLVNNLNDQVSDQQAVITESELRINSINDEIKKRNDELSGLTEILENTKALLRSKDETISALENEISKSKDNQAADGDVSSMGNISRTEEVSRLRDVEDSFEERYMKLRCIAVKMKKNIADLNQQLKNEKTQCNAIQSKLNVAIEQAMRNQALQEECDRITDELELKTKEITELKKIIVEADKKGEKAESSSKQCEILSTQKNDLEMEMKALNSMVDQLKKEKFAEETMKKEMEKEVQKLKQKVKENEDSLKKTQNDLEQANLEVRKRGTLTLEMRDYEKTISDLNEKLKSKNATVDELNEKVKSCAESNVSLVERIKGLEEQISSFGASSKVADEQILNLNRIISTQEKDLETKNNTLKQLKQNVEEEKSQNESLTLQLAELTVETNSLKERLKSIQESSNIQLKVSQSKMKILEEHLKKKESEFEKLKEDFEAYKIRAHNVLQKHKNENNSNNNEGKLETKIKDLSQTVKELRKRLDDTLVDLDNHKTEMKLLEASKEKLHVRMKEIQEGFVEKTKELDNTNVEFKSYKLQNETLMKCYKNEIERWQSSCQQLEAQLEEEKSAKEREIADERKKSVTTLDEKKDDDVSPEKLDHRKHSKNEKPLPANHEEKVRKKSQNHELMSLEKLLKTDITEEHPSSESNAAVEDTAELRKNIEKLESQVAYLNGILNESEKNAANSEQHVAWLKDVNKRLQKTIDRAPHLQNGEYLKNVVFNFFTFPDGEEKCKLITILETLLQLTPEEKNILSAIAKGERSEQKRSSGFASFLKFG
ncbi:GRIP and coiled-coil domain-containing protein 2-like [Planococcus citri]|uniref:GRIP and coiled-coil domain-containing protein 2-like n=1 Tax=Planococcus citri TaxID=170843 RepID=UPI0031F94762